MTSDDARWAPVIEKYSICGLPDDHIDYSSYVVTVGRAYNNLWYVRRGSCYVAVNGDEDILGREDDAVSHPDFFMDFDTAIRVATDRAKTRRIRGRSADDVLRDDARAAGRAA